MLIATFFFWGGRNKMVHVPPGGLGYLRETFSKEGLLTLGRIAMVYVFIIVFWALWGMSNGAEWTLQAEKMDLHWMGMNLIAAQVQTANPILILLFIPLVNSSSVWSINGSSAQAQRTSSALINTLHFSLG